MAKITTAKGKVEIVDPSDLTQADLKRFSKTYRSLIREYISEDPDPAGYMPNEDLILLYQAAASVCIKSWTFKDSDGEPLPLPSEDVAILDTLPTPVTAAIYKELAGKTAVLFPPTFEPSIDPKADTPSSGV